VGSSDWDGVGFEDGWRIVASRQGAYVEERAGGTVGAAGEGSGEAGCGTSLQECGADGVADEVVDEAGLAETDFGFCGMDVDVDFLRRHLEEEQDDREGRGGEDVAIGLAESVEESTVQASTVSWRRPTDGTRASCSAAVGDGA
jgi:hypothetical protein